MFAAEPAAAALSAGVAKAGPPNSVFTWLVFLTFNLPIVGFMAVVPFGRRLNEALKEKTNDGFGMTSYSRVTGAIGAVILTAFFWAIGNVVLMDALSDRGHIAQLLDAVGRFFLVGSALFLPYAFNQLKSIFPWAAATNAAGVSPSVPASASDSVTKVTIANASALSDAEVQKAVQAIAAQVAADFAPEWNASATLAYHRLDLNGATVPVDSAADAIIYLGDAALDPNRGVRVVAGYHDRTHGQIPYGFVYLDVCKKAGEEWSVALSHEVLELLADPTAVMRLDGALPDNPGATVQYALEVCDATQGDVYPSQGVNVCNFVNRAFFGLPGGRPELNHLKRPQSPFTPRPGGYLTYFDDDGPHNVWGPNVTENQQAARVILGEFRRNGRRRSRLSARAGLADDVTMTSGPRATTRAHGRLQSEGEFEW